jgi:hypothetical protein
MRPSAFVLVLGAGLALAAQSAGADVIALGSSRDNTLYESASGFLSNGAGSYLFTGSTAGSEIRRALLAFDVTGSVPAGATINSASLDLSMSKTISGSQPVSLHRVTADWGEAGSDAGGEEGGGAVAQTGDATWLHTFRATGFWASAGGDFAPAPSATQSVGGPAPYTWGSTAAMVSDVQGWLDVPAGNFGWIVIGNESSSFTSKRFNSRENAGESSRPMLTIDFTPIPEPAALFLLAAGGLGMLLRRRRRCVPPEA